MCTLNTGTHIYRTALSGKLIAGFTLTFLFALWSGLSAAGADEAKPSTSKKKSSLPPRPPLPKNAGNRPRSSIGSRQPSVKPRSTKPLPGEPWLVWDSVTSNFGRKLADGTPILGEFTFRNEGEADLHLTKVKPGCGCTAVDYDRVVKPGATGRIKYSIDPFRFVSKRKRAGRSVKTIKVYTDCPGHPYTLIQVKGELYTVLEVIPQSSADFKSIDPKEEAAQTFHLKAHAGRSFEIVAVESDNPAFKATVQDVVKGKQYRVVVSTVPPMKVGHIRGRIVVTTTLKEQRKLVIPTKVFSVPKVFLSPQTLRLSENVRGQDFSIPLSIRTRTKNKKLIRITNVTTSDPAIKTKVIRNTNNRQEWVQVFVPAHYELPPAGSVVTVETDDKEFKTLTVSFVIPDVPTKGEKPKEVKPTTTDASKK